MKQAQMIEQIKKDLRQRHFIPHETLLQLKKILDQIKTNNSRSDTDIQFKEQIMEKVLESLSGHAIVPEIADDVQKSKKIILQILEKDFVSTQHNLKILQKLVEMLQKDSEQIAIQASKALDFLIKHVNQSSTQVLDKHHYLPLLEFLKERSQFLLKLNKHLDEPQFARYKKSAGLPGSTEDRADRATIPNSKSIQFFTLLPNLLIHFMAYVDIWKGDNDEAKIKLILKECIHNIIQAPRKIPYQQLLANMNQEFNSKIYAVMIKFLQYMYILFKTEKQDKKQNNNKNLKRHFKDQIEYISIYEVLMNFLYLVKNCPEDFPTSRTEVINRLKLYIGILSTERLNEQQAYEVVKQLLNEQVIFGKNKFMGEYSRNLITNHWLDSVKSPIIIHHMFKQTITNIKLFQSKDVQQHDKDFVNSFYQIETLFNSIMKIIFDNTLYLSIQERGLETLIQLIDKIFPKVQDTDICNLITTGSLSPNARQFHLTKIELITRVLQGLTRKFHSIDEMFREITKYILDKKQTLEGIKQHEKKMDHIQLQTLPSPISNLNWEKQRAEFVQKNPQEIDSSLLTLNSPQNKFLSIFQEQQELTLNSCPIKPNNTYNYIKDVKNKIIQKCISICHRITEVFIHQNLHQHNTNQMNLLKSVYYYYTSPNKKVLTNDQCSILGDLLLNGLKVFEQLHDYDFHGDQVNKKVHLRSFMLIFAHIYDPINFRDIFEPNMEIFFQMLLKYAKYCSDNCLQWVLIEPFCANPQPVPQSTHQTFNKNIVELLIYNLIIKLEHSPDQLDVFHPFYQYKDQYFSLLQKLIRFPFRCLSRYSDDSFIRNYFRQIVLFLVKKSHTSRYSLDYLHLMRTLFKNILYNCSRENTSPLFVEFQAICCKIPWNNNQQIQYNNFNNVNVLENLHKLFETGIPELADIITELVIMLPLKSKHIIQYARQGYIVKPLLHCLCMMNDYNYTLRTIKTFQIIISHSSCQEISEFLEPIKFKLVSRLFEIVSQCKINDLKSEKIPQDLSSLALKLLAKLGALPRHHQPELNIKKKIVQPNSSEIIQLAFEQTKTNKKLKLSIITAIEHAMELCQKLLDQSYQTHLLSIELLETAFDLLRQSLPMVLREMHYLSERLIVLFASLLALHSKYVTIYPNLLARVREGAKQDLKRHSDYIGNQLSIYGLTEETRFFLKCLLKGLSEKVLITRQDQAVHQISNEPKAYVWSLLNAMLNCLDPLDKRRHTQVYSFIFDQLMYQCVDVGLNSKNSYNLPMKQASLAVIYQLLDKAPDNVIFANAISLIETIFVVCGSLTDLLNLKIAQYPKLISQKLFDKLLKDQQIFNTQIFSTESWNDIFTRILNNLVSYSIASHNIAMSFLNSLCKLPGVNMVSLLYGRPWSEIQDTTSRYTQTQSKYSIKNIIADWDKTPIFHLIKPAERIFNKVNQTIGHNESILKLMTNAFNTLQWLMAIPFEDKKLQAFSIVSEKTNEQGETTFNFEESLAKVIQIAHYIIILNETEYGKYIKIIVEVNPVNPTAPPVLPPVPQQNLSTGPNTNPVNPTNPPNGNKRQPQNVPPRNPRDRAQMNTGPTTNHVHSINPNIYFDDEEYNLNIEDIDLQIKVWGELLSSIIGFLKQSQLADNVFQITKLIQKRKAEVQESPVFINKRSLIIFALFNLIVRVDRTVRNKAYESLKELIGKEQHPKQLLANQQKLKNILKPMLFCLQQEFKKFTPSLLFAFRKILKLLTQCFNSAVIQKLQNHLTEIEKTKDPESPAIKDRIEPVTYPQLMHQIKCISSLLGLFQYLSFAYQSTNPRYTISSIEKITGSTKVVAQYFTQRLGKQSVKPLLKQNLAKLLNTMSPLFPAQVLFSERNSSYFPLIHQMLGMDISYCVRQRMSRDFIFSQKLLDQGERGIVDYQIILNILKTLAVRNTGWLNNNNAVADKLLNKLNLIQVNKNQKQFQTIVYLLVQYARENNNDTRILFQLARLFKIKCTVDLNFLRTFFKYELYKEYDMATKKKIFLEFMTMMKDVSVPIEDKIVINYHMIYQMLLQANKKDEIKILISQEGGIIEAFIDLLKETLSVRQLQTRNLYNYRVAIEVLQLSSFIIKSLQQQLLDYKRPLLPIIWALLKADDKMLKNYAFICISNFIRIFDIGEGGRADTGRVLTIYLTLLKGMEALTQNDFELGALNRKALNILIPYWAQQRSEEHQTETSWIGWTLRILHDQSNQPFRLVRFWEIVVKNHEIFQKSKEGKFQTQMINSMQWLMVASNPASNSPMVKRIASDLSFIYIQWKYKDVCDQISIQRQKLQRGEITEQTFEDARKNIIDKSMSEKAADICLNFFIKVAFHNCTDKEDKDIMKRFLYLLKKMLVLWPNTRKKFDQIEIVIRKLRQNPNYHNPNINPSFSSDSHLRFHAAFLNIINILLEFQQDTQLQGKLMMIFNLFELVGQSVGVQRSQAPGQMGPSNQSLFAVSNAYLLHLIILIIKRLLKVAYMYKENEDSQQFIKQLKIYVKQGLESYVLQNARNKGGAPLPPRVSSARSLFKIELVISVLKLLFEIEKSNVTSCLNHMKQVAGIFKKTFQIKSSNIKDIPMNIPEGTFKTMLSKQSIISLDLFTPEALLLADQNYEKQQMTNSYICKRLFMVIILRIIASEFNQFHLEDKNNIMQIFSSIHNKTPDPALKSQILNLWRCMFMGKDGFADKIIPERYSYIETINFTEFSLNRVFTMLFDDTSKFAEHFDKRKLKTTDQSLPLTERILEQLNTKFYFGFLCQMIEVHGNPGEINQFKLFALFACKVCSNEQIESLFKLIESVYGNNIGILYTLLFEDFKEFNCSEEYLQGDEVMLLFTRFLYRLISKTANITLQVFGSERQVGNITGYYNVLLRSDHPSLKQDTLLIESFNTFVELLPEYNKLPSIITDYLLKAHVSANEGHNWGLALTKMALKKGSLSPQQLYLICSKIGEWGILQYTLENNTEPKNREVSLWLLDNIYSLTSQPDLLYGFRMNQTNSKSLKDAYTQLQQREYRNAIEIINQNMQRDNKRNYNEMNSTEGSKQINTLQKRIEKSYSSDILKECIKELGEWDSFLDNKNKSYDTDMKVNLLFTERDDRYKDRIKGIITDFEDLEMRSLPYFYGRTLINFLQSSSLDKTKECFKQINVALLFSLLDWMNLPKYSKFKQNQILIKTQCLLELEEGNKIKQETISTGNVDANHDAMTKVVQSIFNQINTWRERLPHKFQNMSTWRSILDQRNMIFRLLKKRMQLILETILQGNNSATQTTEKLLVPYQDIEWNNLTLIKQQRVFGVFGIKKYKMEDEKLYQEEILLKIKEMYHYNVDALKNYEGAKMVIDKACSVPGPSDSNFKIDYNRLKANLMVLTGDIKGANNLFAEVSKTSEQESYGFYRDWLNVCFKGYEKIPNNKIEWAKSAVGLLPYGLKSNSKKCRLQIATIFTMLNENIDSQAIDAILKNIVAELPTGALLLWIPQIISLIINPKCVFSECLAELLQKGIAVDYPQAIFYTIQKYKPFDKKALNVKEIYTNIRKIKYNLLSKMERMVKLLEEIANHNLQCIQIPQLGALSRCFSQLYIPSYDFLHQKFENQMQKIPLICRVSQVFNSETRNGKVARVIIFLASDQKHYYFRLEKRASTVQSILGTQCIEIINNSMEYSRESFNRKLKAKEVSKTYLQEQLALVPTSPFSLTLLDILNDFMNKTSFGIDYPENDTSYSRLPINEANKLTHKRMLEIVPENQLKRYIESKANTLDDYFMFRKQFGYNYGPIQLINFIFGNQCYLNDIIIDMSSANIEIDTMRLKTQSKQIPYSVRLSRNITNFLTDTIIYGTILPSMLATVASILRPQLRFKSYLVLMFKELVKNEGTDEKVGEELANTVFERMKSLVGRDNDEDVDQGRIPSKMRIVLETAKKIGALPSTPINLKYWF